jgi:hypothetical protein
MEKQFGETVMRYFYLGQTGREANAPLDEVRKHLWRPAPDFRQPVLINGDVRTVPNDATAARSAGAK